MYVGPHIVTEGLGVAYDFTSRRSWIPGSSTVKDISGNGNTGTVYNSPATQDTDTPAQNLYFNGSNNYIEMTANQTSLWFNNGQTIGMWVYHTINSGRRNFWNQAYGGSGTMTHEQGGGISYYYGSNGADGGSYKGFGSSAIPGNTWSYFCVSRYTGGAKWYINGVNTQTTTDSYTPMSTNTTANIRIGLGYTGVYLQANIASVHAYRDGLSDAEVLQNYNALKGRFI